MLLLCYTYVILSIDSFYTTHLVMPSTYHVTKLTSICTEWSIELNLILLLSGKPFFIHSSSRFPNLNTLSIILTIHLGFITYLFGTLIIDVVFWLGNPRFLSNKQYRGS